MAPETKTRTYHVAVVVLREEKIEGYQVLDLRGDYPPLAKDLSYRAAGARNDLAGRLWEPHVRIGAAEVDTPYLVAVAPFVGQQADRLLRRTGRPPDNQRDVSPSDLAPRGHVVLIGFGPAGQRIGELLARRGTATTVVDLSPQNVDIARAMGLSGVIGDATNAALLAHLHLREAQALVVTLPDLRTVLQVVRAVKATAPDLPILARARYNRFAQNIERAGAEVLDEEVLIGRRLAGRLAARLRRAKT